MKNFHHPLNMILSKEPLGCPNYIMSAKEVDNGTSLGEYNFGMSREMSTLEKESSIERRNPEKEASKEVHNIRLTNCKII